MSVLDEIIPAASTTPEAGSSRWHLRADERSALKALRCYCLRLGATIRVNSDGSLEVSLPDDDVEDLAPYFSSWASMNAVHVEVHARNGTAVAAPVPTSAPLPAVEPVEAVKPVQAVEPMTAVEPVQSVESVPQAEPAAAAAPPTAPDRSVVPLPAKTSDRPRLGDILVMRGLLQRDQLVQALVESRTTGTMLGRVLLEKQWIFEEELARTLSTQWDIPYVSLMRLGVDQGIARLLPRDVGIAAAAIPVRRNSEGAVLVAFADPTDEDSLAAVRPYIAHFTPVIAELTDIMMALRALPG